MKRSLVVALAVAVLTTMAVAAPAHAATGTWSPPVDISSAGVTVFSPQLAVAPNGTIIATWTGNVGGYYVVQAARSTDAGVTWGTPVALSNPAGSSLSAQISVADDGTFVATWIGYGGANGFAQVATSSDSGVTWSSPLSLSAGGQDALNPQVVAATGAIVVAWELDSGFSRTVQAATSNDGGATWSAPVTLSDSGGNADSTTLGVANDGTLFASWTFDGGPSRVVQLSRSANDGATWSVPIDLSAIGGNAFNPRVAASPDGTITVTWQRYGAPFSIIQTSRSTDGGATWSTPLDLSADGRGSYDARVAVAPNGTIAVTWVRGDGAERIVQASTSTNGGATWSAPADLSAAGFYSDAPQLVAGADGTVTVAWKRNVGGGSFVEVATLTAAGATWSAPLQLSQTGGSAYEVDVAAASSGAVTVLWQRDDGLGNNVIQASTLAVSAAAAPGLAAGGSNAGPIALTGAALLLIGLVFVLRRSRHALSWSVTR